MASKIRPEVEKLQKNIEIVIKGKSEVVKNSLIGILAHGHVLFEDVPGVGKTTLAHLIAHSLGLSFARIQFTSDMLPSDILGTTIYDQQKRDFEFKPGPLFANIVLADEINRTTPKTQSALLEAMNSGKVSAEKQTHDLPQPFMVLATQNPIEFHGTFPLPKSQMDRFLLRLQVGYPSPEDEMTILREQREPGNMDAVKSVMNATEMLEMQAAVNNVKIDDDLLHYITRIVAATRNSRLIELGVSTRGALSLRRAAQARAYYENRDFCVPDDVKTMVSPVLAHRIQAVKTFETNGFRRHAEEDVLDQLLNEIEVPV
ncbi:MAG: MoxR family ATPase [Candidatus Sumerlaeaceae bacterium]|nr:MoxR family ATPase [Candidatus Sumerlaeaceae bacterium]